MIEKTEAIVLATHPFSRTSLMVSWLTRDHGRIVTPVRGACRPKSLFLGRIDVAFRSELLFYSRDCGGVHNIRETTPLDIREGLRDDWRAAVAASYICSLTDQSVETLLDAEGLFDDLDRALSSLAGGTPPHDAVVAYEFDLLQRLGIRPDFTRCADCQSPDSRECRFSIPDGRLSCPLRADFTPSRNSVALSRETLSALRLAQGGRPASSFGPKEALAIRRFLGMFLSHHLDLPLTQRRAALAWLDM